MGHSSGISIGQRDSCCSCCSPSSSCSAFGRRVPGRGRDDVGSSAPAGEGKVVDLVHRNLGLLGVVLLALHVVSAVADEYVDIRWWQAFVPFGATYRPVFLAAGALALDILVAVVITALLRQRLGGRGWRVVHQLSYAAWLASVVHTVGIGTDSTNPWVLLVLGVCVGSVVVALSGRFLVGTIRRAAA